MLGVEKVRRFLDVILASEQVLNSTPVSALLIAPSDAGKTELIKQKVPVTARQFADFSYATLMKKLETDNFRRVIVPDFNMVLGHRPAVATLTCAMLLGLLGEGLDEVPGMDGRPRQVNEQMRKRGTRISFLSGMTPEMFNSKRGKWRQTGFLRRILPIFYSYSAATVAMIQTDIAGKPKHDYQSQVFPLPKARNVKIPHACSKEVIPMAERVRGAQLVWRRQWQERSVTEVAFQYPFTLQKSLESYAMTCALLAGRSEVSMKDIEEVRELCRFVRYDRPEEL